MQNGNTPLSGTFDGEWLTVSPSFQYLQTFLFSATFWSATNCSSYCAPCADQTEWLQLSNSMCPTFRAWIAAFPDATWLTSRPFTGLLMKQKSPLSLRDWVLFLPISASYLISTSLLNCSHFHPSFVFAASTSTHYLSHANHTFSPSRLADMLISSYLCT